MREPEKLSNKTEDNRMVSLTVVNVGHQKCTPLYSWGPGIRDHFLIHYISSGKGCYRVGGTVYELTAGDVFLAYPKTEISYQADPKDPWIYEWVGFSGSDARGLIRETDFRKETPVLRQITFGKELEKRLERINAAFGHRVENAARMTGELYLLLALLIKEADEPESARSSAAETVQRAAAYIDQNYSYPISVEEIASYAGVSRSTLFRAFSAETGASPKEYLDNYRIRRAAELLRRSQLTVSAIGMSVGYDNGLYFSKVFHKLMGETPSDYRRRKQNAKEST
ncbi:MAG: AraC family transcriptional regulator [Lachnospiraceae bacterium]|nr:AraC family transcriptional regulator [Lachnospiraceae bacterium]